MRILIVWLVDVPSVSAGASLDPILKRGALVVGLTGKQSLMNALSRKGELIGLDVELAQARFIPG